MSFLPTLWADLQKVFAFAHIFAAINPGAAADVAVAEKAVTALQPVVQAVQDAANGSLDHAGLVAGVTDAIAAGSASLVKQGLVSSTTDDHIQAAAPLIHAAVAISGLAVPPAQ